MPPRTQTACIDFDGVIATYDGWKGPDILGEPIAGVAEGIQRLKDNNWMIIIFTTRLASDKLRTYLNDNKIPFDYINENPEQYPNTNNGKPAAHVYIDDRAITFNGNWVETVDTVLNFKPWYKK